MSWIGNYSKVDGIIGVGAGYNMIDRAVVYDFDNSVRASKFPMSVDVDSLDCDVVDRTLKLASTAPGTGHNNFLSGITVSFDLTMTNKMCVEWQRYHFQQIISSCSTIHRITKMDIDKSYIYYVDSRIVNIMKELIDKYNDYKEEGNEECANEMYLKILYSNPSGMLLTQRVTLNYLQLKTMYNQRKNHKLPEWKKFCKWIETLPYAEEFLI